MHRTPVSVTVQSADEREQRLAIQVGALPAGEATVHFGQAGATIRARVDVEKLRLHDWQLDRFHYELAEELLAHVMNFGAMAQDPNGAITYDLGTRSHSLPLPTNQEVGLGYPNSW